MDQEKEKEERECEHTQAEKCKGARRAGVPKVSLLQMLCAQTQVGGKPCSGGESRLKPGCGRTSLNHTFRN